VIAEAPATEKPSWTPAWAATPQSFDHEKHETHEKHERPLRGQDKLAARPDGKRRGRCAFVFSVFFVVPNAAYATAQVSGL